MRYSRARAPAKVILFGEHFVVNGSRAIATALDLFTSVTAAEKASWPLELESASLGLKCVTGPELTCSSRELEPLLSTIRALRSRGYDVPPARLTVESDIPPSAGLGSSASVSAATAAALTALADQDIGPEELFEVTMEGERVAHGNPSGVDPATVVYGGTIVFRRGQGLENSLNGAWAGQRDYRPSPAGPRKLRAQGAGPPGGVDELLELRGRDAYGGEEAMVYVHEGPHVLKLVAPYGRPGQVYQLLYEAQQVAPEGADPVKEPQHVKHGGRRAPPQAGVRHHQGHAEPPL